MDFKGLCLRIDRNSSLPIHNYYQKILALLFMKGKDPFGRTLLGLECEKNIDGALADLYITWEYHDTIFTEIVEVELQGKKKRIEGKIDNYYGKADFLSFCFPSTKIPPLVKIFPKMKKDLGKLNLVYIIDSEIVTKHKRKIIDDKNMIVSAHSPFMFTKCPSGDMACIKEVMSKHKSLIFDAMMQQHFRKKEQI
jgi:hypothetical protein